MGADFQSSGSVCAAGLLLYYLRVCGCLLVEVSPGSLFLSPGLRVFVFSFFLSAGLRGHVVTLRPSARPTTPCFYGVAAFGVLLTAVLNYMVCSSPLSSLSLSLSPPPGHRGVAAAAAPL